MQGHSNSDKGLWWLLQRGAERGAIDPAWESAATVPEAAATYCKTHGSDWNDDFFATPTSSSEGGDMHKVTRSTHSYRPTPNYFKFYQRC